MILLNFTRPGFLVMDISVPAGVVALLDIFDV